MDVMSTLCDLCRCVQAEFAVIDCRGDIEARSRSGNISSSARVPTNSILGRPTFTALTPNHKP